MTTVATQFVTVNGQDFAWSHESGLDPAAIGALEGYLRREALRTARRFSRLGVDAEDLYQEAVLHCLGAARRFDPTRGAGFLTFASYAVRAAMGTGTRTLVRGSVESPRLVVCSYDAPMSREDGETAWIDTMADDAPDVHQVVEEDERQDRLGVLLNLLNRRDREVLSLRLGLGRAEGLEVRAIASELGLSRAQVEGSLARASLFAQNRLAAAC